MKPPIFRIREFLENKEIPKDDKVIKEFCYLVSNKFYKKIDDTFTCQDENRPHLDTWDRFVALYKSYQHKGILYTDLKEFIENQDKYSFEIYTNILKGVYRPLRLYKFLNKCEYISYIIPTNKIWGIRMNDEIFISRTNKENRRYITTLLHQIKENVMLVFSKSLELEKVEYLCKKADTLEVFRVKKAYKIK